MAKSMGIISRFGKWLDTRFPEKISLDAVTGTIDGLVFDVNEMKNNNLLFKHSENRKAIAELDVKILELKDDINKIKAILQFRQQQQTKMPDMSGAVPWKR